MKEATGELNTTLITVLAIAMLLALFSTFIFPAVLKGLEGRATCAEAICDKGYLPDSYTSLCYAPEKTDDKGNKTGGPSETFECPYRG